jgi:hypothetical protein
MPSIVLFLIVICLELNIIVQLRQSMIYAHRDIKGASSKVIRIQLLIPNQYFTRQKINI